MKLLIVYLMLIVGYLNAGENPVIKPANDSPIPAEAFWVKSEVGMWMASYNIWYKVDVKTQTLKCSYNKRKWKSVTDAVWHDSHGIWYCISQNKMMSSESGKKWIEVTNRTWQDVSGIWFRFDSNFNLYEVVQ